MYRCPTKTFSPVFTLHLFFSFLFFFFFISFSFPLLWPTNQHSTFTFPLSLILHSLSIPRLLFSRWPGGPRTSRKMVGKCMERVSRSFLLLLLFFFLSLLSHYPSSEPKISLSLPRNPNPTSRPSNPKTER
jgi:hypothetical protein